MEMEPRYLIIPAAGVGKRMKPVNPNVPKEMIPVGEKPAIQYAIEEGIASGIKDIIIIIRKEKEIIRQYLEKKTFIKKMFYNLIFLYQKKPIGESDAISLSRNIVKDSPVAIIYPDNLYFPTPGALKILKSVYKRYGIDVIALMEVTQENAPGIGNSGRVDITHLEKDIFRIEKFYPKGNGSFVPRFNRELRTCGIMITGSHIFDYIERTKDTLIEGEFIDLSFKLLILKEKGFLGCRIPGIVFDIGNPKGYELCVSHVSEQHKNTMFPPYPNPLSSKRED